MRLRELAHARTGDKGAVLNISVIAFDPLDYPRLEREVTAARVERLLAPVIHGPVLRYALPELGALNFVLQRKPGQEVTRTLALDAHAKSLSSALLALELEEAEG